MRSLKHFARNLILDVEGPDGLTTHGRTKAVAEFEAAAAAREAEEKQASKKKGKTTFTKLDLTSIIISKHLWSKDGLMAYAQEHGTKSMQNAYSLEYELILIL